jgi:hypothetical protein
VDPLSSLHGASCAAGGGDGLRPEGSCEESEYAVQAAVLLPLGGRKEAVAVLLSSEEFSMDKDFPISTSDKSKAILNLMGHIYHQRHY